jgi:N-acetylglucosaminyl-diphospho-decaprenol L-rhamnosyltransferase
VPDKPAVSVLIVNYNSGVHLGNAVQAVAAQSARKVAIEVIVVDNDSTDGSLAHARAAVADDRRFRFVQARSNLGFAAGANFAASMAQGMWLALLNPDAVPAADWLEQLLAATRRHPDVVMFGSTQIDAGDPQRLDGAGDHYFATGIPWRGGRGWLRAQLPPEGEVFAPCAAACLIRADAFRAANGFDQRFFCYVEDIDLAFRLRLMGESCVQVSAAVVRHVGAASTAKEGSVFAVQSGTRNLVWCFVKCMPGPLFWPLLPFHALTLVALAAKAAANGTLRPVWAGMVTALRGMPSIWRSRRALQRSRCVSARQVARALSWDPIACVRRAPRTLAHVPARTR